MTEPVAYWHIPQIENGEIFVSFNPSKTSNFEDIPLYTAEDLHPRVKMTLAEFDEWKDLYKDRHATTIYDFIIYVLNRSDSYPDMTNKLMCGSGAVKAKSQAKIADLIVNYNPDDPEETIEIVPNMKWFVRSKKPDDEGDFAFISGIETPDDWGYSKLHNGVNDPRACAYAFETKEEAEKWENPLTEAVLLPVEDE